MINKLVLGTVQLGLEYGINNQTGKPSLDSAFEILHTAYDNGIKILDTAESYGDSQGIIGQFQKSNPDKVFNIITKLAANHSLKDNELLSHISNNLNILGVEQLYGYMFHNYQSFKQNENFIDELLVAKKAGIIKKAGISLYTNREIEDIVTNYSDFDFIQIPFNLFDNESKRKYFLDKARKKNIEIHTRSVFLQGLFFKNSNDLPEKLKPLRSPLKILDTIKKHNAMNTETLALQYVLQKPYIDYVLIGVENVQQLLNNITISKENKNIPHQLIDELNIVQEDLLNPSNWN